MAVTREIAIVGAGPYGLATAAHLKKLGIPALVFGETMGAWTRQNAVALVSRSDEYRRTDGRLGIDAFRGAARSRSFALRPSPAIRVAFAVADQNSLRRRA